jgi:CotS family spore coat protein
MYKDKFSKLFLNGFEENINLAEKSVEIASTIDINNLNKSLCHFDYVNKNIIFEPSNNIWVIDFDKCSMGYCVSDICYFLRRLLRRNNTKWNLEIAMNSLNEYEKIKPLNFDEYKYIYSYLVYPQKYWKISRDYYNNIKKCNKNSFVLLLSKYMEKTQNQVIFAKDFENFIEKKFHKKLNKS